MKPEAAAAFIRRQIGEYELLGITTMTAKQRARIEALDVVHPVSKAKAGMALAVAAGLGWPPRQSTGRMRVIDMKLWTITERRAAARDGKRERP